MPVNEKVSRGLVRELVAAVGGEPESFAGRMVAEMVRTCLKLLHEGHDGGQLKLIVSALKELRYAYRVFNRYADYPKLTMFGSARTPEEHPDYVAARRLAELMAEEGWMTITGGGNGIMKAGHEGATRDCSIGLSIRLPFENSANPVIDHDAKHINFRYFFTRKINFTSHADAIVALPGGFGTMDELFESLLLVQTGKGSIIPIVLLEGEGRGYWLGWERYVREELLARGWIGPDDLHLIHRLATPEAAAAHIHHFYRNYHSARYVGERLVLRLKRPLEAGELARLEGEFSDLLASGHMEQCGALPEEGELAALPRLVFHHTRAHFGRVRLLIDRINDLHHRGLPTVPHAAGF